MRACVGRPDRDLVWRLASAVGFNPDAPAPLVAEDVRVEIGRELLVKRRGVTCPAP